MDILKTEILKKRKAATEEIINSEEKFIKRSEIERKREEDYLKDQQDQLSKKRRKEIEDVKIKQKPEEVKEAIEDKIDAHDKLEEISEEELKKRFRAVKEPIKLFGESYAERLRRLKKIEFNLSLKISNSNNAVNQFKQVQEKVNKEIELESYQDHQDHNQQKPSDKKRELVKQYETELHLLNHQLRKNNREKCFTLLYVFYKKLVFEWEDFLNARPKEVRASQEGKNETAIFKQTTANLKPFFSQIKSQSLDEDVVEKVTEIALNVQQREYVKANDAYLQMSIGNACWPIGVTMTGIHERKAQDRIAQAKVAHVLNDEKQRKWIQGVKRLMTFAQKKYPPKDLAKAIG